MTIKERSRPALSLIVAAVVLALGLVRGLGSAVAASESPTPALYGGGTGLWVVVGVVVVAVVAVVAVILLRRRPQAEED